MNHTALVWLTYLFRQPNEILVIDTRMSNYANLMIYDISVFHKSSAAGKFLSVATFTFTSIMYSKKRKKPVFRFPFC